MVTLAGVTGLIVSVGVTVDSYVVYFERLIARATQSRMSKVVGLPISFDRERPRPESDSPALGAHTGQGFDKAR